MYSGEAHALVLALGIVVNKRTDRVPIYILQRFESARNLNEEMTEAWLIAIKTMTDAENEILAEQDKTKVQKAMVKDSLTRAFDELHSGNVHHDARNLFKN